MVDNVMHIFTTVFRACSEWFLHVFLSSGVSSIYFVFIFITLLFHFVLSPIFGRAFSGSDRARKSGNVYAKYNRALKPRGRGSGGSHG